MGHQRSIFESKNVCNKEIPLSECAQNRTQFEIEDFINCKNNLANNRQTRLLVDYNESNSDCDLFKVENKRELLENAKNVLSKMNYFAITEYEELSQLLFEKTFENSFKFINYTIVPLETESSKIAKNFKKSIINKINEANDMDLELYEFAKILFFKRIKFYGIEIDV
jgi:hypothetical protein